MEVVNQVYPSDPAQLEKMMEPGPEGPIVMVNLLKFKEKAQYDDGRETDLSGRDAYMIYGQAVAELLKDYGGRLLFAADVTHLTLGKVEDLWDEVALAEYPNRAALVAMSTSDAFQEISVHRSAGLEGQLNIETVYQPQMPQQLG
jgi:uncharacterized protein (DUF1330 family)